MMNTISPAFAPQNSSVSPVRFGNLPDPKHFDCLDCSNERGEGYYFDMADPIAIIHLFPSDANLVEMSKARFKSVWDKATLGRLIKPKSLLRVSNRNYLQQLRADGKFNDFLKGVVDNFHPQGALNVAQFEALRDLCRDMLADQETVINATDEQIHELVSEKKAAFDENAAPAQVNTDTWDYFKALQKTFIDFETLAEKCDESAIRQAEAQGGHFHGWQG